MAAQGRRRPGAEDFVLSVGFNVQRVFRIVVRLLTSVSRQQNHDLLSGASLLGEAAKFPSDIGSIRSHSVSSRFRKDSNLPMGELESVHQHVAHQDHVVRGAVQLIPLAQDADRSCILSAMLAERGLGNRGLVRVSRPSQNKTTWQAWRRPRGQVCVSS